MKPTTSLIFAATISVVLGLDVWNGSSFTGEHTIVPTPKNRCVRLDRIVTTPIASIKAETCDTECYAYTDAWCEEKWNKVDCQGWGYIQGAQGAQLKTVKCVGP